MAKLNIYDRRERLLVGTADALLAPFRLRRLLRSSHSGRVNRILVLRLERIGDLLMTLQGLAALRSAYPGARIDLVVGSWNADLARAIPTVNGVQALDPAWLSREGEGLGMTALLGAARAWRQNRYDLAINFEPDIRSNLMLFLSGARRTAGFESGGGGPLLDVALPFDVTRHTSDNAIGLVEAVTGSSTARAATLTPLPVPAPALARAQSLLSARGRGRLVGVHTSGGREIKQWPPERFREVARALVETRDATIVLTGAPADRPLVDQVKAGLPPERVIDVAGEIDLVTLGGVLRQLDLLITGDTGPMHLAHAVGTPIVAVFGPSDPARYGPRGPRDRIVRVDLPCSPCNRIRLPPERCVGHTPDCLALVTTAAVLGAATEILAAGDTLPRARAGSAG